MIVLDTDVVIDFLRNEPSVVERIRRALDEGASLAITTVSVGELLRGLEASGSHPRRAALEELIERLEVLPVDLLAARRYGQVLAALDAAGWPIPSMDGLITGVTLENGGRLMTGNTRHFDRVAGLELLEINGGPTEGGR